LFERSRKFVSMDIQLEAVKLSKNLLKTIFLETLRRKSLNRILRDYTCAQEELSGRILDLGSGSDSPSYKKYLRCKEPFSIVYSDYYEEGTNLVKIDLEKPFAIENDSYDFVTCFSVLEHIYDYRNVIRESSRILKRGGRFIGSTPFLHIFHPDPYDYYRYTHQALIRMFAEANFTCEKMVYLGFGPFSAAISHWVTILPAIVREVFVFPALCLDVLLGKFTKSPVMRYALNYFYVFRKK